MLGSRLGQGVLAVLCVAIWSLSHSYLGLFHDAGLYTLQALAHLHPQSLSQDVFLKFGSQDRFTVFSPIYAAAAQWLGVESAAASLTLLSQLALLTGVWAVARAVMPRSMALLGMAVLLAIPGDYGADRIFTCIEPFLTPRMAAQALTLGSIAAALHARQGLAAILIVAAALVHPIMAAAGIAALFWLKVARDRPAWSLALIAGGMLVIAIQAFALPAGLWGRFDATWLALVQSRSPYLFLAHWQLDDWSRLAVSVSTLLVARTALQNVQARALAGITVITVAAGLALTAAAVDLLHLVLFTQLQPWRWQWLGSVIAAVLLPQILCTLWQQQTAGRTAALLLMSAWIFAANAYALFAAAAVLPAAALMHRLNSRQARLILCGACGLLAIAVLWRVASNLEFTDAHYADPTVPWWLRRARSFARDGTAPLMALALGWWLARSTRRRPALLALAVLSAAACAALLPFTWKSWTVHEFTPALNARFAALRERIPAGAEVFWPESPLGAWIVLDRPSYLSVLQTSGIVFTRAGAVELERRAHALGSVVAPSSFMEWNAAGIGLNLSPDQLLRVCATREFEFLASVAKLPFEPVAMTAAAATPAVRLYRCRPRSLSE
jgi:hypothetical protein